MGVVTFDVLQKWYIEEGKWQEFSEKELTTPDERKQNTVRGGVFELEECGNCKLKERQ